MTKRVAIYLRVSTDGQTTENQKRQLHSAAKQRGWEIVTEYDDNGISGAKGREHRKQFDALLKDAVHVDLFLHQQGLDTTTPGGRAMFQMMGVFAEFERAMIVERVNAGLERAKAQGKTLGRPKIAAEKESEIAEALKTGMGVKKTARTLGVGVSTVQRVKKSILESPIA